MSYRVVHTGALLYRHRQIAVFETVQEGKYVARLLNMALRLQRAVAPVRKFKIPKLVKSHTHPLSSPLKGRHRHILPAENAMQRYSREDVQTIHEMHALGRTVDEIRHRFGRSSLGIIQKMYRLHLLQKRGTKKCQTGQKREVR
jgi:hypothetical protein